MVPCTQQLCADNSFHGRPLTEQTGNQELAACIAHPRAQSSENATDASDREDGEAHAADGHPGAVRSILVPCISHQHLPVCLDSVSSHLHLCTVFGRSSPHRPQPISTASGNMRELHV